MEDAKKGKVEPKRRVWQSKLAMMEKTRIYTISIPPPNPQSGSDIQFIDPSRIGQYVLEANRTHWAEQNEAMEGVVAKRKGTPGELVVLNEAAGEREGVLPKWCPPLPAMDKGQSEGEKAVRDELARLQAENATMLAKIKEMEAKK